MTDVRTIDIDATGIDLDGPEPAAGPPPPTNGTETPQSDPEAPWGYLKDGVTPRKKPGRRAPGERRSTRKRPPRKRPAATSSTTKPKTTKAKDFKNAVGSIIQQIVTPLAIIGTRDPRFMADAVVLSEHAEDICTAVNDVAQANPQLAKVLETVEKIGPYGHLSQLAITIGVQVAANHDLIPAPMRSVFGVRDVDDIIGPTEAAPAAA